MTPDPPPTTPPVDEALLASYLAGRLEAEQAAGIEAWLDQLPPEHLQAALDTAQPPGEEPWAELQTGGHALFAGLIRTDRFRRLSVLGRGGMGVVEAAQDDELGRTVAIKRCRPRRPGEPVATYAWLQTLFQREARILARLEHPSIVPLHDVGLDHLGNPAFVMKRLDGQTFDAYLAGLPARDLHPRVSVVLRVAEAIAYAHQSGVVHRDLKPENIIVGQFGAVSVIDWGLATWTGTGSDLPSGGTLEWMAPEQHQPGPAHPYHDVWALGGLLRFAFTGHPPSHPDPTPAMPAALAAVVACCLQPDPAQRYPDGAAVVDELRRWLETGLTQAQRPGPGRRLVVWARRHPLPVILLLMSVALVSGGGLAWLISESVMHHRLAIQVEQIMAQARLGDAEALQTTLFRLEDLVEGHTDHPVVLAARSRLTTAAAALREQAAAQELVQALDGLERRYACSGPWAGEPADRRAVLRQAGLSLEPQHQADDAQRLAGHPARDRLILALIQIERAEVLDLTTQTHGPPHRLSTLIQAATDDPAWQALATLFSRPRPGTHEFILQSADAPLVSIILTREPAADLLLQTHRPDPTLIAHAQTRIQARPAAFWPRLALARAALDAGQLPEAIAHAQVALGAEDRSLWPYRILAYAALRQHHQSALAEAATRGRRIAPANLELLVLEAVSLARSGQQTQAQALIDSAEAAAHFRFHLEHPIGHPMDGSVQALVEAGISIPAVEPRLGPVVPGSHRHH